LNERQQALQEQCKLILQGETTTWKYTMNGKLTDMKVNPGDIVKQGDWIGEFTSVTATDQNHLLVVFTSLPDQQFTTNENMSIGDLVNIDADDLLTLASATVKNTIRFVPNTTIIVEECKHIVGKIAGILNNYGEINIRIDGHVKMSKKIQKESRQNGTSKNVECRKSGIHFTIVGFKWNNRESNDCQRFWWRFSIAKRTRR